MTADWSIESKRAETRREAVRWAEMRAEDLRYSDPDDAKEWATLAVELKHESSCCARARIAEENLSVTQFQHDTVVEQRDKLVKAIARLVQLPPQRVAYDYQVGYSGRSDDCGTVG